MSIQDPESEINKNQFVTLDGVKTHFKFTDTQDDDTLQSIVFSANDELKKRIVAVVDDVEAIEGTKFFPRCRNAALVFVESEIRRQINQLYDEAKTIMKSFESQMTTLLDDMRAIAPARTALEVVTREIPFEDDYFAERHSF